MDAVDPVDGARSPLFNPRAHRWADHFEWTEGASIIRGLTPIGRATVVALDMNHEDLVAARRLWVEVGWHPPETL